MHHGLRGDGRPWTGPSNDGDFQTLTRGYVQPPTIEKASVQMKITAVPVCATTSVLKNVPMLHAFLALCIRNFRLKSVQGREQGGVELRLHASVSVVNQQIGYDKIT